MLYRYIVNILNDKCPECAEGSVFLTRFKMKEKCDLCDAYFIEKNGDNWFFLLFIDRAFFIFPVVVMLYFGLSIELLVLFGILLGYYFCETYHVSIQKTAYIGKGVSKPSLFV